MLMVLHLATATSDKQSSKSGTPYEHEDMQAQLCRYTVQYCRDTKHHMYINRREAGLSLCA